MSSQLMSGPLFAHLPHVVCWVGTRRTEEVLFLCEAAGYDVCLVETVGV